VSETGSARYLFRVTVRLDSAAGFTADTVSEALKKSLGSSIHVV